MALLRPSELARIWELHPKTVYLWIREGKLPAIKTPGAQYRVRTDDARAYCEQNGLPMPRAIASPAGSVAVLGKAVRLAMEKSAEIRKAAPKPAPTFGSGAIASPSAIDGAKIEAILGKGQAKDGMYKFTVGRRATASCGCSVGKTMGVNTWAAFGGSDDAAVVDGDFAVTEDELQKVLASLRASGIDIVAIHHHMTGESPRILFLHYWGKGKAADLAAAVKKALDLTAFDRSA